MSWRAVDNVGGVHVFCAERQSLFETCIYQKKLLVIMDKDMIGQEIADVPITGSRLPTEDEFKQYKARYKRRLAMKLGITGLW